MSPLADPPAAGLVVFQLSTAGSHVTKEAPDKLRRPPRADPAFYRADQ